MGYGNNFKTIVLLAMLTALLLWVGDMLGGPQGLVFAGFFVVLFNFASFWWSDKIVLKMYRAVESTDERLNKIVREVAGLAKIPQPKVYIMNAPYANAFATGRSPKHAAVAATTGILDMLSDSELKGVIAHEISHIKNRDTLISTVAGMIAGIISYVAMMARWAAMFGGMGGRDRDGGNFLELIALMIITPLIATIIQLAISRSREFLADESGAKIMHSGLGLASALEKLEEGKGRVSLKPNSQTNATAHMMIVNPFRGGGFFKLFMTHPPTAERIKRLRKM